MPKYAGIIVNISHESVDRVFSYRIPEHLQEEITIGTSVMIPFGSGNTLRKGYVVSLQEQVSYDENRIKEIDSIVFKQENDEDRMIRLAAWIRERYGSTMIQALKVVLPVKRSVKSRTKKTIPIREEVFSEPELNEEQSLILQDFLGDYHNGKRGTYLIHGITGSGKTRVYIEMIKAVVEKGQKAIVLIPEISLSYQTLMRFYHHFGERVSVVNSTLSEGEKYDRFELAKKGEIDVMIGPRSALFTPFLKLGLIIMDEEHEQSYKSESMPRYHAREVAIQLAQMTGASVVLGSATPSVESYYHAKNGDYKLYTMKNRAGRGMLPRVHMVDLREELRNGNRSVFSDKLAAMMEERLSKKEQIMLFLNRRGYAGFISCRSCGEVIKCPHCDISLSEHRDGRLHCHYCGYTANKPSLCPKCGSKYILGFRAGTQQLEEQVLKLFPKARVLRMDKDTTGKKDSYERILSDFQKGRADILMGTQMIVKGHDFSNVTLMGIIAADLSLAAGDYRAGERTFDLLTQAAGRAGRGNKPGDVVIQTYQPEHYANVYAARQDYEGFYAEEILYRELAGYPPVCHILAVMVQSKDEQEAVETAKRLSGHVLIGMENKNPKPVLVGPAQAGISKISDYYRQIFFIKSAEEMLLTKIKDNLEKSVAGLDLKNVNITFDYDPMNPF